MKCCRCGKPINPNEHFPYRYVGDDPHCPDCMKKLAEEMERICNMSDEDFIKYMNGGAADDNC